MRRVFLVHHSPNVRKLRVLLLGNVTVLEKLLVRRLTVSAKMTTCEIGLFIQKPLRKFFFFLKKKRKQKNCYGTYLFQKQWIRMKLQLLQKCIVLLLLTPHVCLSLFSSPSFFTCLSLSFFSSLLSLLNALCVVCRGFRRKNLQQQR